MSKTEADCIQGASEGPSLAEWLGTQLTALNKSPADLAGILEVKGSTVSHWRRGLRDRISFEVALRFRERLGVTVPRHLVHSCPTILAGASATGTAWAKWLQDHRFAADLTRSQISAVSGVSRKLLSDYEQGRCKSITPRIAAKLEKALGVKIPGVFIK